MAGIGPCGDSSPAAVRPLGKIADAFIGDVENNKSEGKAGVYAAGDREEELEDLDDQIDYVPREEVTEEGAVPQEEDQAQVKNRRRKRSSYASPAARSSRKRGRAQKCLQRPKSKIMS